MLTEDWRDRAACAGLPQAWFFPEDDCVVDPRGPATCATCPVRTDCLEYAVENREEYGVWGGLSAAQRWAERYRRRRTRRERAGVSVQHNRNAYSHGCRCDICRQANAVFQREKRAAEKAAKA